MKGQNNGGENPFYKIPKGVSNTQELLNDLGLSTEELRDFFTGWEFRPNRDVFLETVFPPWVYDLDTLNEWLGDSFYFGNFLKTFWLKKGLRHDGTNEIRELNKRRHYLERLKSKEFSRRF